jgi:hypothetical protein
MTIPVAIALDPWAIETPTAEPNQIVRVVCDVCVGMTGLTIRPLFVENPGERHADDILANRMTEDEDAQKRVAVVQGKCDCGW